MEELKAIIKISKDNFYQCYKAFGPQDQNTQHAYELWKDTVKDTVIGAMEEERKYGR